MFRDSKDRIVYLDENEKNEAEEIYNDYQAGENEEEICNRHGVNYDDFWHIVNTIEGNQDDEE